MLFINFLCLLYLMVLIDSHTISKSIDNDEKVDDIFDSITDLDHTRNPKHRRDRFIHKYRADYKDEYVTPAEPLKETRVLLESEKFTDKNSPRTTTEHTKHHKSPKRRVGGFWRKLRGKDKKPKHADAIQRSRRITKNKESPKYLSTRDSRNTGPRNKIKRKNKSQFVQRQTEVNFAKRDLGEKTLFTSTPPSINPTKHIAHKAYKIKIGFKPQLDSPLKHHILAPKMFDETTTESLSGVLASMTTELSQLKQKYGVEKYNQNGITVSSAEEKPEEVRITSTNNKHPKSTTIVKNIESEFQGTAQIEQLLNDIKLKAIQMVSEQNPLVTDIITNTVTEATFEADPILTHIGMALPGYYLSTFVSINDMVYLNEKRTVPSTNEMMANDSVFITNTEPQYRAGRSIKEDAMTIAHNVEDILQRELKKVYHKVKDKVSSDLRKEIHKAKSTIKDGISKLTGKTTCPTKKKPATTTKCKPPEKPPEKDEKCKEKCKEICKEKCKEKAKEKSKAGATTAPRRSRGEGKYKNDKQKKQNKHDKHTKQEKYDGHERKEKIERDEDEQTANPAPTYDDYMMLTLYEQMLAKTHEDNVRKMLSTADAPVKKKRGHFKLSKRNPETLTDIELREDVERLYDDSVNMPDYEYMGPLTNMSTENPPDADDSNMDPSGTMGGSPSGSMGDNPEMIPGMKKSTTPLIGYTRSSISDTSYEGLSDKISYNDFVNGYRHYLKFQKEQSNQNFSNLIKYQAHRHHSVDDIGKFILNKIPPLPNRRLKRFFDDTDMEYQEITTKSDDSWFKRHFYLFIDNGPPKKFHTSQTVELKSAVTEPDPKLLYTEGIPHHGAQDQVFIRIGNDDTTRFQKDTADLNLDDLSRILDSIKNKQATSPFMKSLTKVNKQTFMPNVRFISTEGDIQLRLVPQGIINKLFGNKRRRLSKRLSTTEYIAAADMFTDNPQRFKRTAPKDDHDNMIEDFLNKEVEKSTSAKDLSGDSAGKSTSKENNKYGYVDIDLVPKQTAVVKLRDNKVHKKSRIKSFFKKFHFRKKSNKSKPKSKRFCQYNYYNTRRRVRFNPLKKLKDMFRVKNDDREDGPVFRLPNMQDYDMMTSHIETFKPIKYDKPLTIDEMQKQIPNISEVLTNDEATSPKRTTKPSYVFRLDDSDRKLLYNYRIVPSSPSSKHKTDRLYLTIMIPVSQAIPSSDFLMDYERAAKVATTTTKEATTTIIPTTTTRITTTTTPKPTKRPKMKEIIPPSNVMTVNVKTLKSTTPTSTKAFDTNSLMTLEDMSVMLNTIQSKLAKSSKAFPKFTTPYFKRGTTMTIINIPAQNMSPLEELTIKSKLTRMAKFPIAKRHFKMKHDADQSDNSNEKFSLHDGTFIKEYIHQLKNRNAAPDRRKLNKSSNQRRINVQPTRFISQGKCKYTDYFNDLLMWHNDILNLDKVPSPIWKNILKNIQSESESYTTPSMGNLLRELNEINDFLDDGPNLNKLMVTRVANASAQVLKRLSNGSIIRNAPVKSLNKQPPGVIRSVAMHDNAIVTSKNLIIKGEAKYYQYNKPKLTNTKLKSNNFRSQLNKLNVYENDFKKGNVKQKGVRRSSPSPSGDGGESSILVDTTLMAYDDEVDFFTKGLEGKKLSRNSQKAVKPAFRAKPSEHAPFLKTNEAPVQYYTTPLPMKSSEFDKFLKEHKMDVESVTSPMLELPSYMDRWAKQKQATKVVKIETLKSSSESHHDKLFDELKIKNKVSTITEKLPKLDGLRSYTSAIDKTIQFTNKLLLTPLDRKKPIKKKKNTNSDDFDRHKRYSELNHLPRNVATGKTGKATPEFNYYNMLKRKMKERLFEKKASFSSDKQPTDMFPIDPHNKEVEITIINFDDINKMTTAQAFESFSMPPFKKEDSAVTESEFVVTESTVETSSKISEFTVKEEVHNGLLYKDIFKERTTSSTSEYSPIDFSKSTEYVDPLLNNNPQVVTANKLRYPFDKIPQIYPNVFGKLPHPKNFNVPKRVHISSHHYKYDIFYDENLKKAKSGADWVARPNQSPMEAFNLTGSQKSLKKVTSKRSLPTITQSSSVSKATHRHRLFTWRGCKPKPTGGLSAPGEEPGKIGRENTAGFSTNLADKVTASRTTSTTASTAEPESPYTRSAASLVYDLKHFKPTTTMNDKERRRSLFKLPSLLQGRFKSLLKNNVTTAKQTAVTKRSKQNRKCNCTYDNETEDRTLSSTFETKKESESELEEQVLDDDGFKISCGINEPKNLSTTRTTGTEENASESQKLHTIQEAMRADTQRYKEKHKGHMFHEMPKESIYVEPDNYNDQAYYEMGPFAKPQSSTQNTDDPDFYMKHYDYKRDVQTQPQNTFTAKDVAALEVIVDLMKNTLSYEEKDIASVFGSNLLLQPHATKSVQNDNTNSIQVHIAIPFDFQNGKKRSPLDPVRVRKVFSAKMSTPVDLEYQVHSFEGTVAPTVSTNGGHSQSANLVSTDDGLSPGMYLLVDKPKSGFALKPVKAKINLSELRTRQAGTTASMTEYKPTETRDETTSLKSLGKVTLSKEFIAAISRQLIELYDNATGVHKNTLTFNRRKARSVWKSKKAKELIENSKKAAESYICKRRIDWEAVKKYFGHDRVCNCKCKANTAMCKACAASDAVIDELIFEFDNIGRYMRDHCTEIQTYFWMNPGGGQKLRESVSRIDKSLGDYYKRVKGKCKGRTCKTFTTYIDKRHITKITKVPREELIANLVNDLSAIADDLNKTIALKTCFNTRLKEEGEKLVHAINTCISKKPCNKRSNFIATTTKGKLVKNVYSLDNINVNIICNPEVSSTTDECYHSTVSGNHGDVTQRLSDHICDFDIVENRHKKRKGFIKLFPRKNKKRVFTYYVTDYTKKPKINFKRDIQATPIISDGGGAFWYDYIRDSTSEPRLVRDSVKDNPDIAIAVVQKGKDGTEKIETITPKKNGQFQNTIYLTVKTTSKRMFPREIETTTDYLTHNINQLLQLFGSLKDIEAMNMHSNRSTMFLNHSTTTTTITLPTTSTTSTINVTETDTRQKNKKSTKCIKKVTTKMHYKLKSQTPPVNSTSQSLEKALKEISAMDPVDPLDTIDNTTDMQEAKNGQPSADSTMSDIPADKHSKTTTDSILVGSSADKTTTPPKHTPKTTQNTTSSSDTIIIRYTSAQKTSEIKTTKLTTASPTTEAITSNNAKTTEKALKKGTSQLIEPLTPKPEKSQAVATSTLPSFFEKLKTASQNFFDNMNKMTQHTTISAGAEVAVGSGEPIINTLMAVQEKINSTASEFAEYGESSQVTTHMSPTIVIINEYDNQFNSDMINDQGQDTEGYKNLLLSIIQYETNKLNDEWHRIAYGGDGNRDDNDFKRSVLNLAKTAAPKSSKSSKATSKKETEIDVFDGVKSLKHLELPDPDPEPKKPKGLLNKLVSKMGIKVVASKKKAVKKQTLREVPNRKRMRRLKLNNFRSADRVTTSTSTMTLNSSPTKKACDSRRTSQPSQLCDIQATYHHISALQKNLSPEDFETVVRNISCYKYKDVNSQFYIPYKKEGKRWDWIRNKRCLKLHFTRIKDESEMEDELDVVDFDDDLNDTFEKYVKGDDGIYKIIKRRKRTTGLDALQLGLMNIPPLKLAEDETYAMLGDTVSFDCLPYAPRSMSDRQLYWRTDRKKMLDQDNVEVGGVKVTISNVEPRNAGRYSCVLNNVVQRDVKLNVMTIPTFDVVFLPIYKTPDSCNYDDLKAIQRLGSSMAEETGCGSACTVRIDEPVCQRDRGTNSSLIRSTAVLTMTPRDLNCSLQCRRDILSSLVMLCAANTPVLSDIGVVLSKDGVNETLAPWKQLVTPVITHTLRKKDTNGHREYHKLVANLAPGKVNVVLICPAGYYLLSEQKLCSSCPQNTSSALGDNTCKSCPRGTRSEPGAASCSVINSHPRRYDWWWYPPCGYLVACCSIVFGCSLCILLALIVHVVSRDPDPVEVGEDGEREVTPKTETSAVMAAYAHTPHTRPISPSRVILARFFKPSLTSSRATDSQETKFELWKERNMPPPLPPIDFDI